MRQTSLQAYKEHYDSGAMGRQEALVYSSIKRSDFRGRTDNEISILTGIKINAVCGRRNSLSKKGLIRCIGKRPCTLTKRYCMAWVIF